MVSCDQDLRIPKPSASAMEEAQCCAVECHVLPEMVFFLHFVAKEAPVSRSPGPPESLALPLRFIDRPACQSQLPSQHRETPAPPVLQYMDEVFCEV